MMVRATGERTTYPRIGLLELRAVAPHGVHRSNDV